ncbi:MAG TPA: hypothetical protein VFK40_12525 [Nitrososphaeraceae archaeon]|nr:hypothetical protein [Nitrososphaeraceae archaeon]
MTAAYNLDRLVHKGVRTNDGNDLGNIISNDGGNITNTRKNNLEFLLNPLTFLMETSYF